MKTSNKLLIVLLAVLIIATVGIDFLLKDKYTKISLNDPYKNYEQVAVRSFKYLKIKGGNAYAIEVRQAAQYDMKVMVSRKTFLKTTQQGDTLLIGFSVASNPLNRDPESLPHGLIISTPVLALITSEGSNTIIRDFKADSLRLVLSGNSVSVFNNTRLGKLAINCRQNSLVNFSSKNQVAALNLRLTESASAFLNDITYASFYPLLGDNSRLIFGPHTALKLQLK